MSKLDMSRFCVLTAPFLHHTLEYGLDAIAANGFSSIELWGARSAQCSLHAGFPWRCIIRNRFGNTR